MQVEHETQQSKLLTAREQLVLWPIRITDLRLQSLIVFQEPEIAFLKMLQNELDLKSKAFVLFVITLFARKP